MCEWWCAHDKTLDTMSCQRNGNLNHSVMSLHCSKNKCRGGCGGPRSLLSLRHVLMEWHVHLSTKRSVVSRNVKHKPVSGYPETPLLSPYPRETNLLFSQRDLKRDVYSSLTNNSQMTLAGQWANK